MVVKNKKKTLPTLANPLKKLFELFWILYLSKSGIEDIDIYELEAFENPQFTRSVRDFIRRETVLLLPPAYQKLMTQLLKIKYTPDKLDLDTVIPIPSDKVFKIAMNQWIKEMIEVLTLCAWPEEDIYNEIKCSTGIEIYTRDDMRSFVYYFWNFQYSEGWDNSFREPLFKYFLSEPVLSNFYSKSIKIFSGEKTPEEMLIEMDVDDSRGILSNSLLFKTRINIKKNLFLSARKGDAEGVSKWGRADQILDKKERVDGERRKIILPSFSSISDKSKSKKDIPSEKDSKK